MSDYKRVLVKVGTNLVADEKNYTKKARRFSLFHQGQ